MARQVSALDTAGCGAGALPAQVLLAVHTGEHPAGIDAVLSAWNSCKLGRVCLCVQIGVRPHVGQWWMCCRWRSPASKGGGGGLGG